jgi:hypothetical protein
MMHRLASYFLVVGVAVAAQVAIAGFSSPSGPVVLTIKGNIGSENAGEAVEFDIDMLEALPQQEIRTETPWHEGAVTFSGPRLSTLFEAAEGSGGILRVVALNDYSADIPLEEVQNYPVILATRINGERIPVREKGPLFVIYPFSDAPELYNEMTFNRSVWQVASIVIE